MSQKTQQGIGPVRDERDDEFDRMDRVTPIDSPIRASQPDLAEPAPTSDRSQFDTIPGGGVNRESGGRAIARAYVSPKTPMPLSGRGRATVSVDVEPSVSEDGRHFRTERALRVASLPPASSEPPPSVKRASFAPLWIAALTALVGGAAIVFLVPATPNDPPVSFERAGPGASAVERPASPRPSAVAPNVEEVPRASVSAASTLPEPLPSSSAPPPKKVRTTSKPVPKPGATSAPKSPSGTKNGSSGDVWLE